MTLLRNGQKPGGYLFENCPNSSKIFSHFTDVHILPTLRPRLGTNRGDTFHVLDVGCDDGGHSHALFTKIIRAVREEEQAQINGESRRQIMLTGDDRQENGWERFFRLLRFDDEESVFVTAAATTMYKQVVPNASVDLAFSAHTTTFLSKSPDGAKPILDHISTLGNTAVDPETMREYEEQARTDWNDFLVSRARELKLGGLLCTVNLCDDNPKSGLHADAMTAFMSDVFNRIWRGMVDSGGITMDEYRRTEPPEYYRSEAEFSAPLLDKDSAAYKEGLRLVKVFTAVTPCVIAEAHRANGDVDAFVRDFVPSVRPYMEDIFAGVLNTSSRSSTEIERVLDKVFDMYAEEVRQNPVGNYRDCVLVYLIAEKVDLPEE